VTWNLFEMGSLWFASPQRSGAKQYLDRALGLVRQLKAPTIVTQHELPQILVWLGILANDDGDPKGAQRQFEEALRLLGSPALRETEGQISGLRLVESEISAQIGLGVSYAKQRVHERAILYFVGACELADQNRSRQAGEARRMLGVFRSEVQGEEWTRLLEVLRSQVGEQEWVRLNRMLSRL
jgi:tetratricopeptide (TPR) repeat protein